MVFNEQPRLNGDISVLNQENKRKRKGLIELKGLDNFASTRNILSVQGSKQIYPERFRTEE